jgi:hypothetical protein
MIFIGVVLVVLFVGLMVYDGGNMSCPKPDNTIQEAWACGKTHNPGGFLGSREAAWMVVAVFAIYFIVAIWRWVRRRRPRSAQ